MEQRQLVSSVAQPAHITRASRGLKSSRIGLYLVLVVAGGLFLLPFYWMLVSSVWPQAQFYQASISLWPHSFSLENFRNLFKQSLFGRGLFNSLLLAVAAVVLQVFFSSLAGYAFAKMVGSIRIGR